MSLTLIELIPISVNKKKELRTFGINIHSTPKPNLKDIRKNIHKVDFHLTQTNEKTNNKKWSIRLKLYTGSSPETAAVPVNDLDS